MNATTELVPPAGSAALRTMFDAVTASLIPRSPAPALVAGYADKIHLAPWSTADWKLFPGSTRLVRIVKKAATNDGHVLDVERGDATPAQAPGWVAMRRGGGADPTVYCNLSTWPDVIAAFAKAKVAQPHYWIAEYDGKPGLLTHGTFVSVAKQYASNDRYDTSAVSAHWPGVDPAPPAPPTPPEDDMTPEQMLAAPIPPNPKPDTVGFVLRDYQRGVGGVNTAGPMALDLLNTASTVNAIKALLAAQAGALPEASADLLGALETGRQQAEAGHTLSPDHLGLIISPIHAALADQPAEVRHAVGRTLLRDVNLGPVGGRHAAPDDTDTDDRPDGGM
jgi:hypothetical protein